jgi:hypothetical protein
VKSSKTDINRGAKYFAVCIVDLQCLPFRGMREASVLTSPSRIA